MSSSDELCGCTFRISPQSFYQVNPVQTKNLYEKAISLAGLTGNERVMDAYCGIGTIGLIASRDAREVISVELNPDAVRDAVTNAKRNQIKNVSFYQNDAGAFMVSMAEKGKPPTRARRPTSSSWTRQEPAVMKPFCPLS